MNTPTTIDCEEALRLLALYLDGELGSVEHAGVKGHLSICRSCYSRAEFERRLKGELAKLRREDASATFERRIRKLIGSFQSEGAPKQSDS
jgi:predicted anti-sigma-YlaC factor YlaD